MTPEEKLHEAEERLKVASTNFWRWFILLALSLAGILVLAAAFPK